MPTKRRHIDWSKWGITLILCGIAYWGLQSCGCSLLTVDIPDFLFGPKGNSPPPPPDDSIMGYVLGIVIPAALGGVVLYRRRKNKGKSNV